MLAAKVIRPAWPNKDKSKKPPPIDDDVFFHKGQVEVGAIFLNMGRLTPRSHWEVREIITHDPSAAAASGYRRRHVKQVERLGDDVKLVCRETGDKRTVQFGSMSYSAIWRLAK